MAILSRIKSAAKKVASFFGGGSNVASAGMSFPGVTSASLRQAEATRNQRAGVQTGLQTYQVQNSPLGQIAVNTRDGSYTGYNEATGPTGPVRYNTSPQSEATRIAALNQPRTITRGGAITSGSSPTVNLASFDIDGTMTPVTLGASSASGPSSLNGGVSSQASMPSMPSYSDPGTVGTRNAAFANLEGYMYDPATGSFVPQKSEEITPEQEERERSKDRWKDVLGLLPQKKSVYDSPEVQAQQAEVRRRQEEVNNYTSQLNSVVAKQNADLLRLREIGSQEGVTETVYGGQQATINREAAIKALPIQAALAGAQGNLALAQDFLTQLTKIREEQVDNEYNYKLELYRFGKERATAEEKKVIDAMEKKDQRAWEMVKLNIADQDAWAKTAAANGQSSLVTQIGNLDPNSVTFRNDLLRLGSQVKKTGSTGSNDVLDILNVARYQELYPDAGVQAGDTEATANQKVAVSNSPEGKLQTQIMGFKEAGTTYQKVISDIKASKTITDKDTALKVAAQVYGQGSTAPTSLAEARAQKLEQEVASLSQSGILKEGDIRAALRSRGFTNAEINASSVGSFMDKLSSFLFAE